MQFISNFHLLLDRTFDVFAFNLFLFTFDLKCPDKLHLKCILYRNFKSFNSRDWVAVGVVVVHAGISAASDCAMVRKVKVTNGMQELRTEEDSLEPRKTA